jgi:hypothetical protein
MAFGSLILCTQTQPSPNTNISDSCHDVAIAIAIHNLFAGTVISIERLCFPHLSLTSRSSLKSCTTTKRRESITGGITRDCYQIVNHSLFLGNTHRSICSPRNSSICEMANLPDEVLGFCRLPYIRSMPAHISYIQDYKT